MAYAGSRMANSLLRAAQGEKGVTEPAFVDSPLYKDQGCEFFSSRIELGPEGVKKIHPVGKINEYEEGLIAAALKDLAKNIAKVKRPYHLDNPVRFSDFENNRARNLSSPTRKVKVRMGIRGFGRMVER